MRCYCGYWDKYLSFHLIRDEMGYVCFLNATILPLIPSQVVGGGFLNPTILPPIPSQVVGAGFLNPTILLPIPSQVVGAGGRSW